MCDLTSKRGERRECLRNNVRDRIESQVELDDEDVSNMFI